MTCIPIHPPPFSLLPSLPLPIIHPLFISTPTTQHTDIDTPGTEIETETETEIEIGIEIGTGIEIEIGTEIEKGGKEIADTEILHTLPITPTLHHHIPNEKEKPHTLHTQKDTPLTQARKKGKKIEQ